METANEFFTFGALEEFSYLFFPRGEASCVRFLNFCCCRTGPRVVLKGRISCFVPLQLNPVLVFPGPLPGSWHGPWQSPCTPTRVAGLVVGGML